MKNCHKLALVEFFLQPTNRDLFHDPDKYRKTPFIQLTQRLDGMKDDPNNPTEKLMPKKDAQAWKTVIYTVLLNFFLNMIFLSVPNYFILLH